MTTPSPESVATFMGITGATEFVAVQKLEEYGGNLNEAVNAHFIGDRHIQEQNLAATATPHYDYSEANNQNNQNRAGLSYAGADTNESLSSHGRGYYGSNDYPNDYPLAQSSASRVHDEDAEDAMLLAAIEASKKEIRESSSQSAHNHSYYDVTPQSHFAREDDDLAHIISLSLQTAEKEEAIRELRAKEENEVLGAHALLAEGERINTNRSKLEWGGISPDELNEALLIETALYGETSNHSSHKFPSLPDLQHHSEKNADPKRQGSSSSGSQLLSETQLIRQQQDADYIASLQVDKQKELNSLNKSETHSSKQEEKHKNTLERTELEKTGDAKKNMLPNEPPLGDEKAITIAVRMPDGGRCERRFFKTDKLQLLFDFIDIYGAVKPGTYRVVRLYPRRAYNVNDRSATLNEVGLSNKNEALFLELIYGSNDYQNDYPLAQSSASRVHDEDAEDAMLLAAIEASKKEIRESSSQNAHNHSYYDVPQQSHFEREDDDLAHVISLSLQTAEKEEAIHELRVKEESEVLGAHALLAEGEKTNTNRSKLEWGGISPDELNEALLIETALYGETSNHSSHKFPSLPDLQHHSEKNADPKRQGSSSSGSQLLSETQLIRQQQDADYIASLQADKQKELNSLNKSETHSSKQEEKHKNTLERTLLYDFIDIYGAVKPGTYRVNDYPLAQSSASRVHDEDAEDAMLLAAIEASKKEIRESSSQNADNHSYYDVPQQSHFEREDDDLAHVISLSLQNDYPLAQSSASRVHDEDAEDAMLLAAIEASKKEIRESSSQNANNHSYYDVPQQSHFEREDDLAHVISLSLQELLTFYGLPLSHTPVEVAVQPPPTSLPHGVQYEIHTLPVDAKAVADGDGLTVYVSTADPRESSRVPSNVHIAAVHREEARSRRNYEEEEALHKQIVDAGYRMILFENEEILAKKYRIRLRGIDAPENAMPYGKEAKTELTKIVQGKSLRVLIYGKDQYQRLVGDIYCNNIFVQELMLKKGLAWHYAAYDKRPELETWEKEARAKRVGLWASKNPEKPWDWRKDRRN